MNRLFKLILKKGFVHIVILLLWQALSLIYHNSITSPIYWLSMLMSTIFTRELWGDVFASFRCLFIGYSTALILGISLGTLIALNKYFRRAFLPLFEVLRPIPPLALIPLLMVLIGIGEAARSIIVFKAAFFPIFLNTWSAVNDINKVYKDVALTLGASKVHIIQNVVLKAATPGIIGGMRIAMQFAWMSIIAAELIGSSKGVGFRIIYYQQFLMIKEIVVGMIIIGLLGFVLDRLILVLRKQMVPWEIS